MRPDVDDAWLSRCEIRSIADLTDVTLADHYYTLTN